MSGMVGRVATLGWVGFLRLLRSRVYLNLIAAGVFLVGAALLFDRLAAGEGGRVFVDVGLALTSVMVAVLAGVSGITLITGEIESKQIHLVLARPISRMEIVLGRFATLALLVVVSNLLLGLVMAGIHVLLDGEGASRLALAALFNSLEGCLVAALALFFGVGSSSTVSALFVTTLFILGRLTVPLLELIEAGKFSGGLAPLMRAVYAGLPHLGRFDLTSWARTGAGFDAGELFASAGYGVVYCAGLLALATWRLSRRDVL